MNIFFDTSALVKFFHEEPGTEKVTDLINNPGNNIFVSDLARLEFVSALYRRYRNNEIDEQSSVFTFEKFGLRQVDPQEY